MSVDPEIFYALESLPALLGPVQFNLLVRALGQHQEIASIPEAERGAYVAKVLPAVAEEAMRRLYDEQNRLFEEFGLTPRQEPEGCRATSPEGEGLSARRSEQADSSRPSRSFGLGG